jgi:dipeptidyl aminopeptidase/acylaminoacyl peptidase
MDCRSLAYRSSDGKQVFGYQFYERQCDRVFIEMAAGLHGGIRPDGITFDPLQTAIAAHLVAEGFHVFFLDRRGSRGYGEDYLAARDFMGRTIDDITIGTQVALERVGAKAALLHGTSSSASEAAVAGMHAPQLYEGVALTSGFYEIAAMIKYERGARRIAPTAELTQGWSAKSLREKSPMTMISEVCSRVRWLLIHGEDDVVVPIGQSMAFAEGLRKVGAPVKTDWLARFPHERDSSDPRTPLGDAHWRTLLAWIKGADR